MVAETHGCETVVYSTIFTSVEKAFSAMKEGHVYVDEDDGSDIIDEEAFDILDKEMATMLEKNPEQSYSFTITICAVHYLVTRIRGIE